MIGKDLEPNACSATIYTIYQTYVWFSLYQFRGIGAVRFLEAMQQSSEMLRYV